MLEALAVGALFGLTAGLSPGPLLALVITQTLRHGPAHGVRVAMAPLITDVPIVVASTLLVGLLSRSEAALGGIALAGALVVGWLAWDTWRADPPGTAAEDGVDQPAPRSWSRGAMVNALSPHPWLFWIAVGSPTLVAAYNTGGPLAAAAFLAGFYLCLVGSKVGIAVMVGRARGRVAGRPYRWLMRGLGAVLAVFAVSLAADGIARLAGLV